MLSALFRFDWLGRDRRVLAGLLPEGGPRRALVLDARFVRPLRGLGHLLLEPGRVGPHAEGSERPELVLLPAPWPRGEDLIALLGRYAGWVPDGGVVILRSAARDRERVAAAFLHAGLRDVSQARIGRGLLTCGVV